MSMLAEKRRKQKWLLNPQGKHWLTDSNKFGLKILESMGWKEGKGLGKQQDGITEPIRVAFKNDSKGLGLKENASSMQQDHFHALLESLNNSQDSNTTKTVMSLEEKSQNSRTRVHYKKFTRGKDLSRYSAKDLANIFEKKSLKKEEPANIIEKKSDDTKTVNRGSMTDYFSNKMANGVKLEHVQNDSDSENEQCFGFGFKRDNDGLGLTNPAFDPLKSTFTVTAKHCLDTIAEIEEEPEDLNHSGEKKVTKPPHKLKKQKKSKEVSDEVEYNRKDTKVKKRKKGIDNPALNDSIDECLSKEVKKRKNSTLCSSVEVVCSNKERKVKKRKKGVDNPALQLNDSVEENRKSGIDNPALDLDLQNEGELILNVVEEPVPAKKLKQKKGLDNYGFDIKAQRIKESTSSISRTIETYQAEVENDINEIKDLPCNEEELYVGEFSNCDGENQKQKDGVLLRFKYASFTKDPHWSIKYNQTANLARKSYKHLIKGDIAVAFKESNLHEIKGYGVGNKM